MTGPQWKERVRRALSRAADQRRVSEVARDLGVDRARLYGFVSRGYLDDAEVERVEQWLVEKGLLIVSDSVESTANTPTQPPDDPLLLASAQLANLADLLKKTDTFDYPTRLALCKEALSGLEKHIMPVAEKWLDRISDKR